MSAVVCYLEKMGNVHAGDVLFGSGGDLGGSGSVAGFCRQQGADG
jgi:hypothetical protein